jgi:hypothetical protein
VSFGSWAERFIVMNRCFVNLLFVMFLAGIAACSAAPSPTPSPVIVIAATEISMETAVAATLTSMAPTDTATPVSTNTPTITPTITPYPTSTNTPIPPPGVYIIALELNPSSPVYHQEVVFRATFLNTTGAPQKYHWFVSIWLSAQSNRFGQTSWDHEFAIAPGTNTYETYSPNWKLTGPDFRYPPCVPFTARVQWKIPPPGNSEPFFTMPDGEDFYLPFQVCPPP